MQEPKGETKREDNNSSVGLGTQMHVKKKDKRETKSEENMCLSYRNATSWGLLQGCKVHCSILCA